MEARQAARAIQLVRNTARMTSRNIAHALLLTRVNAAFQTSDEKDVRQETGRNNVRVLKTSIVRRAAYTRIFREGMLLSELRDQAVKETQGDTRSQQERMVKPLDSASQNAAEFAQEVLDLIGQQETVA